MTDNNHEKMMHTCPGIHPPLSVFYIHECIKFYTIQPNLDAIETLPYFDSHPLPLPW